MRRYEREMYSYLRRYIGNAEMAEDAFQGTFLQVHLKCHQFDPHLLKIFFSFISSYFIVGITNSAFERMPEGHLDVTVFNFV